MPPVQLADLTLEDLLPHRTGMLLIGSVVTATYAGTTQEHWMELSPGGGAQLVLQWPE